MFEDSKKISWITGRRSERQFYESQNHNPIEHSAVIAGIVWLLETDSVLCR